MTHADEELAFYHLSCRPDLTSAVGRPHHWMGTYLVNSALAEVYVQPHEPLLSNIGRVHPNETNKLHL